MKLYPDAALKYVTESGRVRTKASRATTLQHIRHLQSLHPRAELGAFTHDWLQAFCLHPRPDGRPVAAGTIRSRRGQLVSFFEWAAFVELIEVSPAVKLKYSVRPGNTFVRSHTWLSEPQLVSLVRSFPATVAGRRDRVVCMILAFTGLRVFEVAALRWEQFSADLRTLTLIGKGSKLAEVGVPPQLVEVLWKWRMTCLSDEVVIPAVRAVNNFAGGGGVRASRRLGTSARHLWDPHHRARRWHPDRCPVVAAARPAPLLRRDPRSEGCAAAGHLARVAPLEHRHHGPVPREEPRTRDRGRGGLRDRHGRSR